MFWNSIKEDEKSPEEVALESFLQGDDNLVGQVYEALFFIGKNLRNREAFQRDAGEALCERLSSLPFPRLVKLGESFHQRNEWYYDWQRLRPSLFRDGVWSDEAYLWLCGFGTFHRCGYYREACVDALRGLGKPAAGFLILAMNDPQPTIRCKTFSAVQELLPKCDLRDLLRLLPHVDKTLRGERRVDTDAQRLRELLATGIRAHLSEFKPQMLRTMDYYSRRLCYGALLEKDYLNREQLTELLRLERDPFNRKAIARQFLRRMGREPDFLQMILRDRSGEIRLMALEYRYGDESAPLDGLEAYLLDPTRKVREYAQFLYRNRKVGDCAAFYRSKLDTECREAALIGLCDIAGKGDLALLRPHLGESLKSTKAVLAALGRAGDPADEELLLNWLCGEQSGISKAAFLALQAGNRLYDCAKLRKAIEQAAFPHAIERAFQLLEAAICWESLPHMIELCRNPALRERSLEALSRWRYNFMSPFENQKARVRKAFEECRSALSESAVSSVMETMRIWKI